MTTKEKLRYALYMALTWPLALLPMGALYAVSDGLRFLLHRVLRYRLKVVRRNLETTFPDMTAEERKKIERDFYSQLADTVVENVKLLHISDRELKRRIKVTNGHLVEKLTADGHPVILYLAHYGNWEWMTGIRYYYSRGIGSYHIYLEQKDRAADRLMWKLRSRMGSHGIEVKRAAREIMRLAGEKSAMMVGFISDHRFNSVPRQQSTMFLGHDTPYYLGGEVIGSKIGARYLYLDVEKPRRGHYELTFKEVVPADNAPNAITRRYMAMLEETIRRRPGLWLWSHKRWPEIFKTPENNK